MDYRKEQQQARDMKRAWLDRDETEAELDLYNENREITEGYIESLMSGTLEDGSDLFTEN